MVKAITRVHLVHLVSADSALTLRPSQSTWAVSPLVGCYYPHYQRHLLLLVIPKDDIRFTVPLRVEG